VTVPFGGGEPSYMSLDGERDQQLGIEDGRAVPAAWTVKDSKGQVLSHFLAASRLEVARKVVPMRYDAFRLEVSSSYREMFDRDLKSVLDREKWKIVPVKQPHRGRRRSTTQLTLNLG
jgi:hypothetical protein